LRVRGDAGRIIVSRPADQPWTQKAEESDWS
jgi:hypothetical protein